MPKFLEVTNKAAARAAIEVPSTTTALTYATGLDATGVADCRTALQAIIDAAPSGSTVHLPPGKFLISGELLIDKPLKLVGCGGRFNTLGTSDPNWAGPGYANTTITTSSSTANGIKVTAKGVILEDFAVVNTRAFASAPTAGVGIIFEGANQYALSRVTVHGFYDCVKTAGFWWTIDSCTFYSPVRYGIYLSSFEGNPDAPLGDAGDCGISNCVIATARLSTSAVRWEAGGGVRYVNNKINYAVSPGKWEYGIDIAVAQGVNTGEMSFIGGAIGWCTKSAIRINRQQTTGSVRYILISGMGFQGIGSAAADSVAIDIGTGVNSLVAYQVVITGCSFHQWFGGGIVASFTQALTIGPNVWSCEQSAGGPSLTTPLVKVNPGVYQLSLHRQNVFRQVASQTFTILEDLRGIGNSLQLDGTIDRRYSTNIGLFNDSAGPGWNNWRTQFTIEPPDQGGAGIIDVQLSGRESAAAVPGYQNRWFVKRIRRAYEKNNTTVGGAITVSTVGTDENIGTTNYLEVRVVDAGSGKLAVQARILTDGTSIAGEIQCDVVGRVKKYSIGVGV